MSGQEIVNICEKEVLKRPLYWYGTKSPTYELREIHTDQKLQKLEKMSQYKSMKVTITI